ncbi:MAG: 3-oxoacid CoA-transferase subunit A [Alphaproteobacteria bacterium]|jgi:3-oxoadipate CoA-transferase alpha subunit|nr:3-oxoacid CoA-transferase subunit A [Alphaproteobacteria bacterium]
MINKVVGDVAQAMAGVASGASIMISGFGNAGIPAALIRVLSDNDLDNLTLIINAIRRVDECSPALFGERRVARVISTSFRGPDAWPSNFERQWMDGTVALEIQPQGTFAERIRAGGAGIAAFYTPTAVGTPLVEGRELRDFDGQTYVLETALTADVALLRAQKADRFGNLFFQGTQANFGTVMATAATLTIVEVEEISDVPLPPKQVHLPGIYVQRVVQVSRS